MGFREGKEEKICGSEKAEEMQAVHAYVPSQVVRVTQEENEFLPEVDDEVVDEKRDFIPHIFEAGESEGQKIPNAFGKKEKGGWKFEEKHHDSDEDGVESKKVGGYVEYPGGNVSWGEKGEKEKENDKAQRVEGSPYQSQAGCFAQGKAGSGEDVDFGDIATGVGWGDPAQKISGEHNG